MYFEVVAMWSYFQNVLTHYTYADDFEHSRLHGQYLNSSASWSRCRFLCCLYWFSCWCGRHSFSASSTLSPNCMVYSLPIVYFHLHMLWFIVVCLYMTSWHSLLEEFILSLFLWCSLCFNDSDKSALNSSFYIRLSPPELFSFKKISVELCWNFATLMEKLIIW